MNTFIVIAPLKVQSFSILESR